MKYKKKNKIEKRFYYRKLNQFIKEKLYRNKQHFKYELHGKMILACVSIYGGMVGKRMLQVFLQLSLNGAMLMKLMYEQ